MKTSFVCLFHYNGPWYWQLGFHIYPPAPNIEIHVPFGFFRIGWEADYTKKDTTQVRDIGYQEGIWQVTKYTSKDYL